MLKKMWLIIQQLSWLIEKRHACKTHDALFKISDLRQNRQGEHLVLVRLTNQATTFLCKPSLIVNDDKLLAGFCQRDVRAITYLATQEIFQPKYQIISQQFCDTLKHIIFQIQQRGNPRLLKRSADQLSKDKNILTQLSQEDAHRVGFASAIEQSAREREFFDYLHQC